MHLCTPLRPLSPGGQPVFPRAPGRPPRQINTRDALSIRCCSLPSDREKKKQRVPGSQVINIAGDVHISIGEGRVQSVGWDAVAISPEAKALLQKHAVKAGTALKMHNVLGFEDVDDVLHLNPDLLARLKLKPLQLRPLLSMLRDWRLEPSEIKEERHPLDDEEQQAHAQQPAPEQHAGSSPPTGHAHKLSIWHLDTGTCIATLDGNAQAEFAVSVRPEWRGLVTVRQNRVDCVRQAALSWMDTVEGRCGEEHCVEVRPHAGYAVSGHLNHMLHVWDVNNARHDCIASFEFQ